MIHDRKCNDYIPLENFFNVCLNFIIKILHKIGDLI